MTTEIPATQLTSCRERPVRSADVGDTVSASNSNAHLTGQPRPDQASHDTKEVAR